MKSFFKRFFLSHWPRKLVSLVLSIAIWVAVSHSLTTTKILRNIPVRIVNIPTGKTVEGLQDNGLLMKKLSLLIEGNKTALEKLSSSDLEIVVDAADKTDEWIVSVKKSHLISFNPEVRISKDIHNVSRASFIVRLTNLVTDKIPVLITQPIGEAPRGYQLLDVWPYQLSLTVKGPEELVKQLKAKKQKLTFNLNEISKADLDELSASSSSLRRDEVSFIVPDSWKQIYIPQLSSNPIEIDDPQAKALRIDFVRCTLLPLNEPIPVSLFFPLEYNSLLNPDTCSIATNECVRKIMGLPMITEPLYAKGVSPLFLQVVRNMLQIAIIVVPKEESRFLDWSIQFINPRILEEKYVSILMSDVAEEELRHLQPHLREEYLRNRFRSYMYRFQLFKANDTTLELLSELDGNLVRVKESS